MDELAREFLIESHEGLNRMERCLTDLESRPRDAALIAEIFRSVHTIKGTTGFLGYQRLEKLAHAGENLLAMMRDGKVLADAEVITALLELLDGLRSILRAIEADESEGTGDDARLIQRLEELKTATGDHPRPVPPADSGGEKPRMDQPPAEAMASAAEDPVRSAPHTSITPAPPSRPSSVTSAPQPEPRMTAADATLRVDLALLNRMMNLVGELVLTRNQLLQATATVPALTSVSRRLDMITSDLREAVMKARMQPMSRVFAKIPRMVRDLCQALGRQVRVEIEGQETELDKSLLEAIKDPLTHAVRNALDHGIEPPAVRIAAGKDPEGTLKLRAVQEGSHVILSISEDGAGISVDRIREKAIERGFLTAENAGRLRDHELLQFIFVPGFSTSSAVTKVSGRGVGMDVVRTNVENVGGKVELDSRPGEGTTLRLRIPLTLAIIPALILRSCGQIFALPQAALLELVHIPGQKAASAIEWIEDAPLYRLRGKLLPLVFLDRMLFAGSSRRAEPRDSYIAVLDADGRRFGLVVDALENPEEIVVKPLHTALKDIAIYSGATVLGSGNLALILDPAAIAIRAGVALADQAKDSSAVTHDPALPAAAEAQYLLVDIAGRRAAVSLDQVIRIEQVPVSRIEYIDRRPVLNFKGQLLPVEDTGGLLAAVESGTQIVIVVCRDGDRHVGFAVSHVADVAAGSDLFEAGTSRRSQGVMLLKDRVTAVVDLAQVAPLPDRGMAERTAAVEALP